MNHYHGLYYLSFYVRAADSKEKWQRVYALWDLEGVTVDPPEGQMTLEETTEWKIHAALVEHLNDQGVKEKEIEAAKWQIEMFDNNGGPLIDYSFLSAVKENPFDTLSLNFIVSMDGYDVLVRG
jgi:hypothetical protein